MSIQSEWLPATVDNPAEFTLEYATVKVQAAFNKLTKEVRVRLATEFDTDWQEVRFDEWFSDYEGTTDAVFEALYPMLKTLATNMVNRDKRALLDAAINELEQRNSGLIRG